MEMMGEEFTCLTSDHINKRMLQFNLTQILFSNTIFRYRMLNQFLSKLSQNFIELLEDKEYYDTTIEVGEEPNVRIFRAHMNILCYRSPYIRRALASNKKNNDNVLVHI